MNVYEVRKSSRTFQDKPLSSENLDKISRFINHPANLVGPFGNKFKFDLVIEKKTQDEQKIGTYGIIKNAQGYILGSSNTDTKSLFDYAFVFENIVLYLTKLNIGTCWLAGRFRKQHAMSHLPLEEGQIIPAITPFGYAAEKPRLKERLARNILKVNTRLPENRLFFYQSFDTPLDGHAEGFKLALHYLRIAPSAKNKQPWRLLFSKDFTKVHFYILSSLADNQLYMCEPEYLDIGVAYNHFKAGLDSSGICGKLSIKNPEITKPDGYKYITTWTRD